MSPGIAIFGSGPLARLLVDELQSRGMKIEAVWSYDNETAKCFATEYQIPISSTQIDNILLLPAVHLVVIACVPHFHSQIFSKACQIGKHVICSLPPCETVFDIKHMQDAASNYSALITLFLSPLRLLPSLQLMRRLIQRDKFVGSIRSICGAVNCDVQNLCKDKTILWDKFMGGGLLALFGSNMIDVITFVTGLSIRKVLGIIKSFGQFGQSHSAVLSNNGDDFVTFQMELSDPESQNEHPRHNTVRVAQECKEFCVASITLNGLQYDHQINHDLIIYGTKGYLAFRNGNLYGKLKDDADNSTLTNGLEYTTKENVFYLQEFGDSQTNKSVQCSTIPSLYETGYREMVHAISQAFPDADTEVQADSDSGQWTKKPVEDAVTLEEAGNLQRVIDAIKLSAQTHQWIRVDYN